MPLPFRHAKRTAEDFAEEVESHIELETDRLVAPGIPMEEARATARRSFGNVTTARESFHDRQHAVWLEQLQQDVRYALRRLRRTPWVTAIIVASLALVTGANTTIFGLVHSIYLRRLELPRASELVAVRPMSGGGTVTVTNRSYQQLRRTPALPEMAAYAFEGLAVGAAEPRTMLYGDVVSGNYFRVLGITPMIGRFFTEAEDSMAAPVVVVSYDFWHTHLSGDSAAIGRSLRINDHLFTLIGVTPRSFTGLYAAHSIQVMLPITTAGGMGITDLPLHYLDLIARVPPGDARIRAADALQRALISCCQNLPVDRGVALAGKAPLIVPGDAPTGDTRYGTTDVRPHVDLTDASHGLNWSDDFRSDYREVLLSLLAAVTLLTVLACANVATLQLARAASRRRELAVRASLGASKGRLTRQLLTESILLSLAGGATGLVLARLATTLLLQHLPPSAARLRDVIAWRADPVVFAFTALTLLLCTLFFGLWPAWRTARVDLRSHLGGDRPGRASPRGWPAENALVVAQVSLALVLVTAAALFVTTLRNLAGANGGDAAHGLVVAQLSLGDSDHPESLDRYHHELRNALGAIPGVTAVAFASSIPVMNEMWSGTTVRQVGAGPADRNSPFIPSASVDPEFFRVTGVPLVRGRTFTSDDVRSGNRVVIVSASFPPKLIGDRDLIGARLLVGSDSVPVEVIGVVGDANFGSPRQAPTAMLYLPITPSHYAYPSVALSVRAAGHAPQVRDAIAKLIGTRYSSLTTRKVSTIEEYLDDALARERLVAFLAAIFGAIALLLATMGLYGLLSHQTTRRTREIGVRMALGASQGHALWLVVKQGVLLTIAGLCLGIPLSVAAARIVRAQLFGVGVSDPRTLIGCAAGLALVGLLAAMIPGRRATRIDPMTALRVD